MREAPARPHHFGTEKGKTVAILTALLPFLLQLIQWLFGKDGPFGQREAKRLTRIILLARKMEQRAIERGLEIPDNGIDERVLMRMPRKRKAK